MGASMVNAVPFTSGPESDAYFDAEVIVSKCRAQRSETSYPLEISNSDSGSGDLSSTSATSDGNWEIGDDSGDEDENEGEDEDEGEHEVCIDESSYESATALDFSGQISDTSPEQNNSNDNDNGIDILLDRERNLSTNSFTVENKWTSASATNFVYVNIVLLWAYISHAVEYIIVFARGRLSKYNKRYENVESTMISSSIFDPDAICDDLNSFDDTDIEANHHPARGLQALHKRGIVTISNAFTNKLSSLRSAESNLSEIELVHFNSVESIKTTSETLIHSHGGGVRDKYKDRHDDIDDGYESSSAASVSILSDDDAIAENEPDPDHSINYIDKNSINLYKIQYSGHFISQSSYDIKSGANNNSSHSNNSSIGNTSRDGDAKTLRVDCSRVGAWDGVSASFPSILPTLKGYFYHIYEEIGQSNNNTTTDDTCVDNSAELNEKEMYNNVEYEYEYQYEHFDNKSNTTSEEIDSSGKNCQSNNKKISFNDADYDWLISKE